MNTNETSPAWKIWLLFGLTWTVWMFSVISTFHCSFIKVEMLAKGFEAKGFEPKGFGHFNKQYYAGDYDTDNKLGCIRYDENVGGIYSEISSGIIDFLSESGIYPDFYSDFLDGTSSHATEKAGKAFSLMFFLLMTFVAPSLTAMLFFVPSRFTRTKFLLVTKVLLPICWVCNLLQFSVVKACKDALTFKPTIPRNSQLLDDLLNSLGSNYNNYGNVNLGVKLPECKLGGASIVAILNIFILLALIVLSFLVTLPSHPVFVCYQEQPHQENDSQAKDAESGVAPHPISVPNAAEVEIIVTKVDKQDDETPSAPSNESDEGTHEIEHGDSDRDGDHSF